MALAGTSPTIKLPASPAGSTMRASATMANTAGFGATMRPGSNASSPKNHPLSTTGRSMVRGHSAGSLGTTMNKTFRATQQSDAEASMWSTKWRPAPEHLVTEWHSLSGTAKGAVMQAKDELQQGQAQAYLSNCGLGNPGASLVAEILQNARLRTINLQSNQIGDPGAVQLAEALEPITGLQVICLANNCIGDVGAARIAKLIPQLGSLRLVSLDRNRVGDRGASVLLTALGQNAQRKTEVVLVHNPVRRLNQKALESLASVVESVDRLSKVGIALGTLLKLYTDGVKDGSIRPRQTTTGEVMQRLLLPACAKAIKSYAEAVTPGTPPPMATVIHAWDALFEDTVRTVARHACGQRNVEVLDPSHHQWCFSPEWTGKSYFIDAFCVNQHAHHNVRCDGELSRFTERPTFALGSTYCQVDRLDLVAHKIVQRGGRILVAVDNDNLLLTRIHCLHEIHQAIQDRLPIDVIFSGVRVFPKGRRAEMVQMAEASVNQTRQMILESVRDGPGGYDRFNQVVLDFIDKHVDREFNAVLDQFESKPY